jgi:hypothetical protein
MASSTPTPTPLPGYTADEIDVPLAEPHEPPDYTLSHELSPSYVPEAFNQPLITYHLRATEKNTLHFVSFEPATSNTQPSYEISYRKRSALTLFTRKPDISIARIAPSSYDGGTMVVARAVFHDDGGFPYCPRARMTLNTNAEHREDATIEMKSRDWTNWTYTHESVPNTWTLCDVPRGIELQHSPSSANPSPPVIARFTYKNGVGTKVLAGGEVGELSIWRDALTESVEGREVAVLGCLVVIRHFDRVGKVGRIDGRGGAWGGGFD